MRRLFLVTILAALLLAGFGPAAPAQTTETAPAAAETPISGWAAQLDTIAERLAKQDISDFALSEIRNELEAVRGNARKWIEDQTPALNAAQAELDAIGAPPAEGEEPEPPGLVAQREELKRRVGAIAGQVKEAEVVLGRSSRLIADLVEIRRTRFTARILSRGPSPVSPQVWARALPELGVITKSVWNSAKRAVTSPQFEQRLRDSIYVVLGAVALSVLLVWPVHRWLLRRYGRDPSIARPNFMQALRATLVVGAARALLPTAAASLVFVAVLSAGLLTETGVKIAWAVLLGIILFSWTVAFFRASLSPMQPNWRIVPVTSSFARGVRGVVIGLALIFAVDLVLSQVIVSYNARLAITVLRDYLLTAIATAVLLVLLLRQKMWRSDDPADAAPRWRWLRLVLGFGLIVLLIAGAFGYVALARFAVTQLVLTGGLILLVLILHQLGHELFAHALSDETWLGEQLRLSLRLDEAGTVRFRFWMGLAYDLLLLLCGLIVGLFVWGADRRDVAEWVYMALFGFQIRDFSFSLVSLFVAVALFAGLIVATRFIQRILAEQVLPQTQLDPGIRQSIRTGTGYVGIIIAAVVGISALGLDLSNLAIVAGALSVGIGFGLQNVVNNFVSGLILLVERPVKVGDWVVVGGQQGYVKRIKVRATEIQTFDRASVFVPNSQLISEAVTNWTYADKMGRVIIPIGVAYGSDTGKVIRILREIGRAHPDVLEQPAPSAIFRGFGDSALNFELRCFLADVEKTLSVTSDLCLSIDNAFREHGIEIPFPQHDVYVKELASGPERAEI